MDSFLCVVISLFSFLFWSVFVFFSFLFFQNYWVVGRLTFFFSFIAPLSFPILFPPSLSSSESISYPLYLPPVSLISEFVIFISINLPFPLFIYIWSSFLPPQIIDFSRISFLWFRLSSQILPFLSLPFFLLLNSPEFSLSSLFPSFFSFLCFFLPSFRFSLPYLALLPFPYLLPFLRFIYPSLSPTLPSFFTLPSSLLIQFPCFSFCSSNILFLHFISLLLVM